MAIGRISGWKYLTSLYKFIVSDGTERTVFDEAGYLYQRNTKLTASGADLNSTTATLANTATKAVSSSAKACSVNGLNIVAGGTGLSDATLAAPTVGAVCTIRIGTLSSGSVVVKTPSGVTFDGTNNTATFDAVNEALMLQYKSATAWDIVLNVGAVALSST